MCDDLEKAFRTRCLKISDETDPRKPELLKQRLRLFLSEKPLSENAAPIPGKGPDSGGS
jgi:hypothetical protein